MQVLAINLRKFLNLILTDIMNNEILFHKLYLINQIFEHKSKMNQSEMNNLSRGQGRVLAVLKRKDGISTKDLALILGISISAVNSLLTKLEKNSFIIKTHSDDDKRVLLVKLTEKGRNHTINPILDYDILNCLSDEQKLEFNKCLNLIINEMQLDVKKENPEKFEKIAKQRSELFKELLGNNEKDAYWFDMI